VPVAAGGRSRPSRGGGPRAPARGRRKRRPAAPTRKNAACRPDRTIRSRKVGPDSGKRGRGHRSPRAEHSSNSRRGSRDSHFRPPSASGLHLDRHAGLRGHRPGGDGRAPGPAPAGQGASGVPAGGALPRGVRRRAPSGAAAAAGVPGTACLSGVALFRVWTFGSAPPSSNIRTSDTSIQWVA
jgi:hypothetical protein